MLGKRFAVSELLSNGFFFAELILSANGIVRGLSLFVVTCPTTLIDDDVQRKAKE